MLLIRRRPFGVTAPFLLWATTAIVPASGAWAQGLDTYDLGTITLKGLNRVVSVEDAAASVQVIDAETIERDTGNASLQEAVRDVPNVYFPGTVGAPVIRGQPTEGPNRGAAAFFAGTTPRATISVDGRRLGFNELNFGTATLWDVESVEVYRGPQTTSQGPNSIAGAIVLNTKDPTFEREGAFRLSYGSHGRRQISGAFSQALSKDVAVRLSFDHTERDTYIDFTNPAFDPGQAPIGEKNTTGRFKLLWAPEEIPELELKLTYSYTETEGQHAEPYQEPFRDRRSAVTNPAGWTNQIHSTALDASYEFDNGMRLTNRLLYADTKTRRYVNPNTQGGAAVDSKELSNDLRLTFGDDTTRLSGVAGLYLSRVKAEESVDLSGFFGGVSDFNDTKESKGLYAELTYDLTDRWSVTGGLRYQSDRINRKGAVSFRGVAPVDFDKTFDALLPSLSIAYDVNDDVTAGFAYSKGMNPGGVSYSFRQGRYVEFKEETANNYELFLRGSYLDGRLSVAGNLFYTDLKNAQRNVITALSPTAFEAITVNAEKAKSYGLEVSGNYVATDRLRLWGSAGLLKTEFQSFTSAVDDYAGNSFANAPEYTLTIGAAYNVTDRFTISGGATHVAGYYSDDKNTAAFKTSPYTLINLQAEYRPEFGGAFYGYVNNLTDKAAVTSITPGVRGAGPTARLVAPREIGFGYRMEF